jgi:2-phospho-L-lactate guanylyltransferase (CobY/MobA/RfbA family)
LIQLWTVEVQRLEFALREIGIDASFTRADFEAALDAALAHDHFDVAIFDRDTPGLTRETVEKCIASCGRELPLVVLDRETVGTNVLAVIAPRRN